MLKLGLAALPQFFLILCAASLLAAQQQERPVVKSNVNEVLVPVVVRDGQGKAVGNLTKENFQILDNGKSQVISGFTVIDRATKPSDAIAASSSAPSSSSKKAPPPSSAQRFVVFLFDDLNLSTNDLSLAQKAVGKLLEASLLASDTAAVLSTSGTNSGFTRDRAKLQQAILNLKSNNIYRYNSRDCPNTPLQHRRICALFFVKLERPAGPVFPLLKADHPRPLASPVVYAFT